MRRLSESEKRALIVLAIALVARLVPLFLLPQSTRMTGDSGEYTELGASLLAGRGYTRDLAPPFSPYLGRVPAYPFFIAGVWLVTGTSLFALSLVQSVLDAGTAVLVYAIARRRGFGDHVALGAGLLYALLPFTVGTAGQIMSESICSLLFALALYAHTRAVHAELPGRWGWLSLSAVCWASVVLARPYLAPLVPIAGVLLVWELRWRAGLSWRSTFAPLLVFGGVCAAGLAPWVLRNAAVARETQTSFVPLQLYGSRKPYTTMYRPGFSRFMASFDEPFVWTAAYKAPRANYLTQQEKRETQQLFDEIKERDGVVTPEMDAKFERLTAERYQRAPLRLRVWRPISMALKAWFSPRTGALRISRGMDIDSAPRWLTALFFLINAAVSLLAMLGLISAIGRKPAGRYDFALLAFAPVLTTVVAVLVAMRESRLMMPLFPVVCVAAALGAFMSTIRIGAAVKQRFGSSETGAARST